MIYPSNFEQKTGFAQVRLLLSDKCLSPLGKELVAEMNFSSDYKKIADRLDQVCEFICILQGEEDFPTNYFFDVRYSLKRIRPEGTWLDEKELFDLKRSLQTISDILLFFRPTDEGEIRYPKLSELAGDTVSFPQVIKKIDSILDKFGKIKDTASPELMAIRREMSMTMGNISRSLQAILRAAQSEGIVDKDVSPTMRDGRLMIPVAPAFKRKIKGIVHDESATGKTVFIEPEVVVEANNRIRELEGEEKREIIKILTAFTDMIRPLAHDILHSYLLLAEMDFIRAKAIFSLEVEAVRPVVEDKPQIDWARAIHPLLYIALKRQQKQVVPLDILLTEEKRILIISGPNAGGKSVCLKTVGLLQYMMQCGLLVPMYESSKMGIFSNLFIDIGDEQSIENDLSTYSSHLTHMKYFVRNCDERTIILIDEFGSGTEPQIGGAIAEALLDRFNRHHSFGVITTHYQNLKHFAEDTQGVVNGAMLYDRHLMQPLFKLSIGNPGSSFAVEIARKIGLPEDVIAEASEKVGQDYINMDKYLQDIVRDKRYWENKRQNIHQKEKRLDEVIAKYEKDLEEVYTQRKDLIKEAKSEASRILSDANAKIENTIREIKEAQAEKERTKQIRQKLQNFREEMLEVNKENDAITRKMAKLKERAEKKKQKQKKNSATSFDKEVITVGDNVRLKGQMSSGSVMEIHDDSAVVAFGMIKSVVKLDRLEKVSKGQIKKDAQKSTFISEQTADRMHEKKLNFKQEIDVRGMRGDEALQAVTYFIDDAIQVGALQVRILHGTGSGILRQLIREYLRTVPGVKNFHDEHVQFGGAGITVVDLD